MTNEDKPKRGRPRKAKVTKPKKKQVRTIPNVDKFKGKRKGGGQPGNKNAEHWTEEVALNLGHDMIRWMREKPQNLFYKEYLVFENDYDPDILAYLGTKFSSFAELKKRIETMQELKLQKYANSKMIHPTMAIFSLKNNHGYTDKRDVTTGGEKIDRKIEIEILKND